jgi:Ser/Thr protein kinase RdoA (MazF antagonist)
MALDQNDLHARNVFRPDPAGPLRFFDFGDAVWGHPFATLGSVREDVDDAVITSYLWEWTDLAPLDVLRKELELAEPLHVVHRLVSWHRLLEHADEVECAAWTVHIEHWLRELVRAYG